jgi:glycosyltransferase involved in cell wall biosynthesis
MLQRGRSRLREDLADLAEVIVVDDGSTDSTREQLGALEQSMPLVVLRHDRNRGKGAALCTAVAHATGDIVVIQDADLEYSPADIRRLVQPIIDGRADAVYGSRYTRGARQGYLSSRLVNTVLTGLCNALNGTRLTDITTGYKAFRRETLCGLGLVEPRFGIDAEITGRLARQGCRVGEVPVSYRPRSYAQGKKVRPRDALRALYATVRYARWSRPRTPQGETRTSMGP